MALALMIQTRYGSKDDDIHSSADDDVFESGHGVAIQESSKVVALARMTSRSLDLSRYAEQYDKRRWHPLQCRRGRLYGRTLSAFNTPTVGADNESCRNPPPDMRAEDTEYTFRGEASL